MNVTVAIVDDDPVTVMLHKVIVKKELGVDAIHFPGGDGILGFLKNRKEETPCLLLLDIHMGGISGWDVLDAIQEEAYRYTIRCFLVSSSVDVHDRKKAMRYPEVIAYLEKPLDETSFRTIDQIKFLANNARG